MDVSAGGDHGLADGLRDAAAARTCRGVVWGRQRGTRDVRPYGHLDRQCAMTLLYCGHA